MRGNKRPLRRLFWRRRGSWRAVLSTRASEAGAEPLSLGPANFNLQFSSARFLTMTPEQQNVQHESRSAEVKRVVIIGLDPSIIDYSSPDFAAFPGLTAEKVIAGIIAAEESLKALGYDVQHCLIDFGQTAETVVTAKLLKHHFDCILVGAGVRAVPSNLILFEKLINIIHQHAPNSKICFNTNPADTLDALQRWI